MGCSIINSGKRQILSNIDNHNAAASGSLQPNSKTRKTEDQTVNTVNEFIFKLDNILGMENGDRFQNIYRLANIIATGSHSEVRVCFNRDTGAKRAVKIFKKRLITNQSIKSHLDQEILILKSLDHPNIVKIYEYFEDSKNFYIIMEYCSGGELFAEIIKRPSFTESEVSQIMCQLFSVLAYVHEHGILHRNIKPENVLLEEKNKLISIKLVDFGTAVFKADSLKQLQNHNVAYYIAPEAIEGNYNEKSDLWSCGVLMYILLAGYPPFNGINDSEIIENIKKGEYDIENDHWPSVSAGAKELISLLLIDEDKRLSALQALQHPWIIQTIDNSLPNIEVMEPVLNKLKTFHATSKFREAVHTFIAVQCISNKEMKALSEIFIAMDINRDGKVSKEEIINQYIKIVGPINAQAEAELIMKEVDTDANGFIDYTEFLKATIDIRKMLSVENLKAAFKLFDRDGNGKISKNELKKVLGGEVIDDDHIWSNIIREADKNGDGEIDLQEFQELILSKT